MSTQGINLQARKMRKLSPKETVKLHYPSAFCTYRAKMLGGGEFTVYAKSKSTGNLVRTAIGASSQQAWQNAMAVLRLHNTYVKMET